MSEDRHPRFERALDRQLEKHEASGLATWAGQADADRKRGREEQEVQEARKVPAGETRPGGEVSADDVDSASGTPGHWP